MFPIIIVLILGEVGRMLYNIFSFGDPSYLILVGLIAGALFGTFYRQIVNRVMFGVAGAISVALSLGFVALA